MTTTRIDSKQAMAGFARAHADDTAITWSAEPGPGGTLIITEHDGPRPAPELTPELAATAA